MIGAERFVLIGCLLQGALGREWAIWMPWSIEALSGSCVLIPCRFDIPSSWDSSLAYDPPSVSGQWFRYRIKVFDSRSQSASSLRGKITGDLLQKNCTTVLENPPISYGGYYYFRLDSPYLKQTFAQQSVQINIKDSPPKPKLTLEKVEVMEGTSVSLSCSAAAPCPEFPPNLTWTPRLSDSLDQLQENEDRTKSVSSVLTFTASHLHHGQNITCRALYKLEQGDIQKTSEASRILRVLYGPKNTSVSVSPSGSVLDGSSVTLTCSSNANPAVQNYTWYKGNGTEMNTVGTGQNLTFNVTESSGSEQYYCEAQNEHGKENSTTVQLELDCFGITSLLIGAGASAGAVMMICLIMQLILKLSRRLKGGRDGDTYASLQLPNISPEYDVLQVKNKHQKHTGTTQEENDDYQNPEDGNKPDSGAN